MSAIRVDCRFYDAPMWRDAPGDSIAMWLITQCWINEHGRPIPAQTFLDLCTARLPQQTLSDLVSRGALVWTGDYTFLDVAPVQRWYRARRPKITKAMREKVYLRDNHTCRHCGATDDLSVDHIEPLVLGGEHHTDNMQTLCRSCNSRKGARV